MKDNFKIITVEWQDYSTTVINLLINDDRLLCHHNDSDSSIRKLISAYDNQDAEEWLM